jgi:riboflavin biosynthesis pyrimidine reductase
MSKVFVDVGISLDGYLAGPNVIQQHLNAGLVDELTLHIAPIILGKGVRLFENIDKEKISFEINEAVASNEVTHLFYNVVRK